MNATQRHGGIPFGGQLADFKTMNFILINAPDFILLAASTERTAPHPLGRPKYLNPVFTDLAWLVGATQLEDGYSAPLTFEGQSIRAMRRILERYGFDLPPLTVGEFYGLLEYCDRLDALTGNGVFVPDQFSEWQKLSAGLECDTVAPGSRAVALYSVGDMQGLRCLHREQGTLAQLGRTYGEFAESMSHLTKLV